MRYDKGPLISIPDGLEYFGDNIAISFCSQEGVMLESYNIKRAGELKVFATRIAIKGCGLLDLYNDHTPLIFTASARKNIGRELKKIDNLTAENFIEKLLGLPLDVHEDLKLIKELHERKVVIKFKPNNTSNSYA